MAYLLVTEHWQKHVYKQNFYMLKSGTTDYLQSMWTFVTVYKDIQTMPRFLFSVLFWFFLCLFCLFVFVHLVIDVELHLLVLLIDSEPINNVDSDTVLQCLREPC